MTDFFQQDSSTYIYLLKKQTHQTKCGYILTKVFKIITLIYFTLKINEVISRDGDKNASVLNV